MSIAKNILLSRKVMNNRVKALYRVNTVPLND